MERKAAAFLKTVANNYACLTDMQPCSAVFCLLIQRAYHKWRGLGNGQRGLYDVLKEWEAESSAESEPNK